VEIFSKRKGFGVQMVVFPILVDGMVLKSPEVVYINFNGICRNLPSS